MFRFSEKAAIKLDDLLIFDVKEINETIEKNQTLFKDLLLEYSKSKHTAYGYNHLGHMIKISYNNDLVEKIVLVKDRPKSKRIRMTISYDGTMFHGFQYQNKSRTVQGEISKIVNKMNQNTDLVQGASRTDAYVHALEQVIHFDTELDISAIKWKEILNHQLPKDIYILSAQEMHPLFHSRYDVFKKTYIYKISIKDYNPLLVNYLVFFKDLDIDIMKDNIKSIIGTHDFSSFSKTKVDDPVRTIYQAGIHFNNDLIEIEISGNGFLRYMIRYIVDYLIKLGQRQVTLPLKDVLDSKNRIHTKSLAPANGLYLKSIEY